MNIIVIRSDGSWYTRPDTSVEKEPKDLYLPESFTSATLYEAFWIRIIKAGKAIAAKFAGRYIEGSFRKAMVVYGNDGCCCIDGSTYLSDVVVETSEEMKNQAVEALCRITPVMSIRIGDVLIVERPDSKVIRRGEPLSESILLR